MPAAIHSVTSTHMYPQLDNTFSDRIAVAKVSGLYLAQSNADAVLRNLIA